MALSGVILPNTIMKYLKMYPKKEQKGSKGKADTHRSAHQKLTA